MFDPAIGRPHQFGRRPEQFVVSYMAETNPGKGAIWIITK